MALLADLMNMPVSSTVIALCIGIWFYEWNNRVSYESVGISYAKFARQGEYWRIVSASFSHLDLMHLVFNMGSLYSCGTIEIAKGSMFYFQNTIILIFVSMLIAMGTYHILLTRFAMRQYENTVAVGYSCVVFGWMTILSLYQPDAAISLPGNLKLPVSITPFISLFVTQIIVRRASFIGHASGIVAGLLIGWGFFSWITPYWFMSSLVYLLLFVLVSLKTTTNMRVPCIEIPEGGGGNDRRTAVRGGVLRHHNTRVQPQGDEWV